MQPTERRLRLQVAKAVALEAGRLAMRFFRNRDALSIETKLNALDLVSQADREVEQLIRTQLLDAFPEDGFLGEESGSHSGQGAWVVDPIDGTYPFLKGTPVWCTSIAYHLEGQAQVGVIYDPNTDELFSAARGEGAFLNGKRLELPTTEGLSGGTIAIGHSPKVSNDPSIRAMEFVLQQGGLYQRNGSGALMAVYVAAGRHVAFYETHINSWDCLAALLMIEEAGGWTNDFLANDGLHQGNYLIAGAPGTEPVMQELLAYARPETWLATRTHWV
ncbi:MAG: inositol monophosphatase family protein [bacterium]|jgi:myo-inositol-1(or 4)-monophosphatase